VLNVVEKEREVKQTTPAPAPSPEVPPIEEKEEIKVADGRRSDKSSLNFTVFSVGVSDIFCKSDPSFLSRHGGMASTSVPVRCVDHGTGRQYSPFVLFNVQKSYLLFFIYSLKDINMH
jgi:hypothetical protein